MKKKAKKKAGTTLVRIKASTLEKLRERKAETGIPMRELAERALDLYLSQPGS